MTWTHTQNFEKISVALPNRLKLKESDTINLYPKNLQLQATLWSHCWQDLEAHVWQHWTWAGTSFKELYEKLSLISASQISDSELADLISSAFEELDIDGSGRMQKNGLLLAEKILPPLYVFSHAVLCEYHGRLLVLSQRFEEACLMLRDAFDVYPQKTAGFRACGQLLQFCAAFMQLNGRLSEPRAKQRAHPQAGRWTSQKSLAKTGSGFSHC